MEDVTPDLEPLPGAKGGPWRRGIMVDLIPDLEPLPGAKDGPWRRGVHGGCYPRLGAPSWG